MRYAVGDVIETTNWHDDWNGLYVILSVSQDEKGNTDYTCRPIFCHRSMSGKRSFTSGHNVKIGHIDDISSFVADF